MDTREFNYTFQNYESIKWYSHKEDMEIISSIYPELIFKLDGDGEDYDDYWYEIYTNGKSIADKRRITSFNTNIIPEKLIKDCFSVYMLSFNIKVSNINNKDMDDISIRMNSVVKNDGDGSDFESNVEKDSLYINGAYYSPNYDELIKLSLKYPEIEIAFTYLSEDYSEGHGDYRLWLKDGKAKLTAAEYAYI